ncbi:MAG: hypothetical protein L0241_19105 [Planctomycetia bacterium]|nr:hypothetical protein [Planctomycetia bacterium]
MCRRSAVRCVTGLVGCVVALVTTSCRGEGWEKCYPATGLVTLDGAPLDGAEVWLIPTDEALAKRNPPIRPFAMSDKDGKLVFMTYTAGDGAPAGQYKARIICERKVKGVKNLDDEEEATRNILPAKFADPETSGFIVTVTAGDNTFPTFELKK